MKYRRALTFKECFQDLPDEIKIKAKEKFKLFKQNPNHPSLRTKKMKGYEGIWEGHVTLEYVFTFHKRSDPKTGQVTIVFRKIGTHDIYRNP